MFNPRSLEIIGDSLHNLWVSLDYDEDPSAVHPVIFFTPNMANTCEHYHIELTVEQARKLRDWLDQHVAAQERKHEPAGTQESDQHGR